MVKDDDFGAAATEPFEVDPVDPRGDLKIPCLVVMAGPSMGLIFEIPTGESKIGRAPDAEVHVREDGISRYHAVVRRSAGEECRICDLGSTNGVFVNGQRIRDSALTAGDRIQVGKSTVIKFEFSGEITSQFHSELIQASTHDPLTNVFNRRYLEQHLEADYHLAVRHHEELSVLFVDIDRFKKVNDTHGHGGGDTILRSLAGRLSTRVRGEDILARFGGEEFVLILRRTDAVGAQAVAEALREMVASTSFTYRGVRIPVTVSIGVATLAGDCQYQSSRELLRAADAAMYRAKEAGRNKVVVAEVADERSDR